MAHRPHHLLFVCTANICRSPMAAGWARARAAAAGIPVEVRSGGTMGIIGRPADPLAIRVMGEVGVDLSAHHSAGLDEAQLCWADQILVMELRHQRAIFERFPAHADRVLQLGPLGGAYEVADPVGGWRWRFRRSRDLIGRCVDGLMAHLDPAGANVPEVAPTVGPGPAPALTR